MVTNVYTVSCWQDYYPDPWNVVFTTGKEEEAKELADLIVTLPEGYTEADYDAREIILKEIEEKYDVKIWGRPDNVKIYALDLSTMEWSGEGYW